MIRTTLTPAHIIAIAWIAFTFCPYIVAVMAGLSWWRWAVICLATGPAGMFLVAHRLTKR